ncbi:MAG: hypothetical protein WDM77_15215 [Steroidobacteraceae bacterium]
MTLPQSLPGIIAGSLLVFIPAVGEYVVPSLLGRTDQLMIGRVLSDEFFQKPGLAAGERRGHTHAATAGGTHHAVPALRRSPDARSPMKTSGAFARTMLGVGLTFLYAPILSMMVFSLNNSRLVTVWDAAHSPTLSGMPNCWATMKSSPRPGCRSGLRSSPPAARWYWARLPGVALARFGPFRGRTLMVGMTTAPLVMPEVITGLALLLLFITLQQAIGWPHGTAW